MTHSPTDSRDTPETDADRERLDAMFKMLRASEDVAHLMAGVKQQFMSTGGYSDANAEQCAILYWQSSLQVLAQAQQPATSQPEAAEETATELARATDLIGQFTAATRALLATLRLTTAGWVVKSGAPFTDAVDTMLRTAGIPRPAITVS